MRVRSNLILWTSRAMHRRWFDNVELTHNNRV